MKISELIAQLEAIKAEHGDLPVYQYGEDGYCWEAPDVGFFHLTDVGGEVFAAQHKAGPSTSPGVLI